MGTKWWEQANHPYLQNLLMWVQIVSWVFIIWSKWWKQKQIIVERIASHSGWDVKKEITTEREYCKKDSDWKRNEELNWREEVSRDLQKETIGNKEEKE